MESSMPELQEIKSEIGGVDFGAHQGSASSTPQPHQNFQWVSPSLNLLLFPLQRASDQKNGLFCSCKTGKNSGCWESNLFIIYRRQSLIYRDAAILMSLLSPQTITRRRREKSSKLQNCDNAPKIGGNLQKTNTTGTTDCKRSKPRSFKFDIFWMQKNTANLQFRICRNFPCTALKSLFISFVHKRTIISNAAIVVWRYLPLPTSERRPVTCPMSQPGSVLS